MGLGDYPKEYDAAKHGPYDPSRFYGKPDTPFGDVLLGDLGGWFHRRDKNPRAWIQCISRGYWRWQHKYVQPKRCGTAAIWHYFICSMTFFYIINHPRISGHKNAKYH